jgi:hypothetical protein
MTTRKRAPWARKAIEIAAAVAVVWMSMAMLGYGIAARRYDATKRAEKGVVSGGVVVGRWSWGLGWFGDICFRVKDDAHEYCVSQDTVDGSKDGPGNIFWDLSPGTVVGFKAYSGRVIELIRYPNTNREKHLVRYGVAVAKVEQSLTEESGGMFFLLGGLILPVGYWTGRRRLLKRLEA